MERETGTESESIVLRSIDASEDLVVRSVVAEALAARDDQGFDSNALKWRQLARLGIEPQDGEQPAEVWLRAMAELNGVPSTTPAQPALASAILASRGAARFLFWLA